MRSYFFNINVLKILNIVLKQIQLPNILTLIQKPLETTLQKDNDDCYPKIHVNNKDRYTVIFSSFRSFFDQQEKRAPFSLIQNI